ncbi:hypothetical protein Tco_0791011, partial [Tanacetum coccineum]
MVVTRTANPLALVAQQQSAYHPQNHPNHNSQYSSTRSQQATRNRGKAIVNSSAPTYDQEPAMVTEDEEMSKDKEIDKLMALVSLSFKKIYKPTNNNLRTSSNTSRANQDNSPIINRGTRYENQRVINVVGARENVGTSVVQKSGIQCYNYKEYGYVSRECQKPKRAKDAAYHKEKMLLRKQEEARVQLNAEQANWKDDTDDESDDQELEAHYMYMAQIQEVTPDTTDTSGPIFDTEPLQKVQNDNDHHNVFAIESEHPEQPESVNDTYLVPQGKIDVIVGLSSKEVESTLLGQWLSGMRDLENPIDVPIILENPSPNVNHFYFATIPLRGGKQFGNEDYSVKKKRRKKPRKKNIKLGGKRYEREVSLDMQLAGILKFTPPGLQMGNLSPKQNTNMIAPGMYKINTRSTQTRTPQLPQDNRKTNKRVSFSTRVIPTTCVSRPQLKSTQMEDRVVQNNSQVKTKEVEDHRRSETLLRSNIVV